MPPASATASASSLAASRPLTLEEAVRIGLAFNRNIQAAYLGRDTQLFDLYVAEGKFIPKATLSGAYKTLSGAGGRARQIDGGVTSSLALPTGGTLSLSTAR